MLSKSRPVPAPGRISPGRRLREAALHPLSLACGLLIANALLYGATFTLQSEPAGHGPAEVRVAPVDTVATCPACTPAP